MKQRIKIQANWTKHRNRVCLLGAALAISPAAHAQTPRFSVTSEQVVTAMQGHAWPIEDVRVTLPTAITAAVADPRLGIETASMVTAHEARLRIVCLVPAACLPFFASAVWPESAEAVKLPSDRSTGSAARKSLPSAEPAADTKESSPARIRAGSPVTLVLEGERIHIRLQAVCLQGGGAGDKVRVTSRDHKQNYVAEIVTPTLLKGRLAE